MKKIIFLEILRQLKAKPNLMKKVKIFAVVGGVGFLMVSALVVWVGFSAFNYVTNKANEVIHSPQALAQLNNLKDEVKEISGVQPVNCWGKAQALMAVEPWLARPALENLNNLKLACLKQEAAICHGDECLQKKELINTNEGITI